MSGEQEKKVKRQAGPDPAAHNYWARSWNFIGGCGGGAGQG